MNSAPIKIGLLGCGTVGRGVVDLVRQNHARVAEGSDRRVEITKILVRDLDKDRGVDARLLTRDPADIVESADVDVVVEVLGNLEPARSLVSRALASGTPVVTANKKLLATSHRELLSMAAQAGTRLNYEACVCGGVPVIRSLRYVLQSDRVRRICGVVNGTCNYVLTRMGSTGDTLEAALRDAQKKGFAESDPSGDIDGTDSAEKIAIISGEAFGVAMRVDEMPIRGIGEIEPVDIQEARSLRLVFKLVAMTEPRDDGTFDTGVHPVLLHPDHALASVPEEQNRVVIQTESCGALTLGGCGAGSLPTASAILADVLDAVKQPSCSVSNEHWQRASCRQPWGRVPHYIRYATQPKASLPEWCLDTLADHGVSIKTIAIRQDEQRPDIQNVFVVTQPCEHTKIVKAAEVMSEGRSGVIAPIWTRSRFGASIEC